MTRRSPPPFLLDTHIWIWYLAGSERLPRSLRGAVADADAGDQVWLSPISIWELGVLAERGRARIPSGVRAWADDAQQRAPMREASMNREVAIVTSELSLPHGDPADRVIAATALVYDLTLVTLDQSMIEARVVPTRSR